MYVLQSQAALSFSFVHAFVFVNEISSGSLQDLFELLMRVAFIQVILYTSHNVVTSSDFPPEMDTRSITQSLILKGCLFRQQNAFFFFLFQSMWLKL